jgi:hypothetical protein
MRWVQGIVEIKYPSFNVFEVLFHHDLQIAFGAAKGNCGLSQGELLGLIA